RDGPVVFDLPVAAVARAAVGAGVVVERLPGGGGSDRQLVRVGVGDLSQQVSSANVPAAVAAAVVVVAVGGVCFGSGSLHTVAPWRALDIRPGGASGKYVPPE